MGILRPSLGRSPLRQAAADWPRPGTQAVLLLLVTAVATVLRLYRIGEWGFWTDEMFSVTGVEDGFNFSPWRQSLSLTLISRSVAAFGVAEWSARIAPALIGLATVPILFFLVRRLATPFTALSSALLLAISPWHIYWSQNARFYTALLLFFTLALFFFFLGFEEDRPAYVALAVGCLGLAAKERLLALFFIPICLLYLLILFLRPAARPPGFRLRNLLLMFAPGALLGFLFAGPYLQDWPAWLAGFGFANNNPLWLVGGFLYYVGLANVVVGLVGAVYLLRQGNRAALFLLITAITPIVVLAFIAPFHYTANRYAFVSLTSWVILAGMAWTALRRREGPAIRPITLAIGFLLIGQPLGDDLRYFTVQNGNRDNWKSAFEFVDENRLEGDLVASRDTQLANYYLQSETLGFRHLDFIALAERSERIWFVEDQVAPTLHPNLHQWLLTNARLMATFDVQFQARNFQMRVFLYDPT